MRVLKPAVSALIAGFLIVGLGACASAPAEAKGATGEVNASAQAEKAPREYEPLEFMDMVIESQQQAGSFRMIMSISAASAMSMEAAMVFDNGNGKPGLDAAVDADGTQMSLRLVDDRTYIQIESLTGEKYVQVDPTDEGNPFLPVAEQMTSIDPVQQSQDVRGAATSVTLVGPEDVDGVEATRYTVTVDPGKVTGKTAEGFGASLLGIDEILYDYWLDEADRPIQVVSTFEIDGTPMTTTMKMSDWGAIPPIVAPSADQLTTLEELGLVG
ncbi:hypothetical protein [Agromyces humatus]|uniref:LppX_LprAFG lipoprotein n=1 Tax=Agromyces humatus TaxID=279573 RepID=A0ABP4WZ30_9MICO|nr:hypothetical protein [Agromyces humatus]